MPIVHRHGSRRLAAVAIAAVIPAVGMLAAAPPVSAHPFGPPLSARLDVDGAEVAVTWTAAEDDWVSLGEFLGAFTGQTDQTGGTGEQLTGAELLAGSDNLPSYLLSHFVIEQDGQPCEGQVTQLQDLLTLGAQLVYTCPQPVDSVELTVTTLTDVNENYRTVVTSDVASEPEQALFTSTTATQQWSFDDSAGGGTAQTALMAAGALILAGAAGGLLWWRRSGARPAAAADERAAAPTVGAAL
ncbi:hypothetical protein [Jiangella alkaliphila]|uniref:LPXTG-motif cell wall anchor domain-containing protein n=1 Tax=Jiangella alkaliphila TaxID=419479 RepID=A0A1H2GPR8_9ACTN|nr:hypothetical protein [Jiangella alkaliphila]SDU21348.1 hypothetical protein SAMN04488563_0602 [Jiangella alkaliphila]